MWDVVWLIVSMTHKVFKSRKVQKLFFRLRVFAFVVHPLLIGYAFVAYYRKQLDDEYLNSKSTHYDRWLLALVCIASYCLWFAARLQLGPHFGVLPNASIPLVKTGLFAYFRSPIYLFGTLMLSSYVLLIGQARLLLFIVFVLVPVQVLRTMLERNALLRRFEDEYRSYERRLWL